MKNKDISDFIAASMDNVLNSKSHQSLFNKQYYKKAQPTSYLGPDSVGEFVTRYNNNDTVGNYKGIVDAYNLAKEHIHEVIQQMNVQLLNLNELNSDDRYGERVLNSDFTSRYSTWDITKVTSMTPEDALDVIDALIAINKNAAKETQRICNQLEMDPRDSRLPVCRTAADKFEAFAFRLRTDIRPHILAFKNIKDKIPQETPPTPTPPPSPDPGGSIHPERQYNLNLLLINKGQPFTPLKIDGRRGPDTEIAIEQARDILGMTDASENELFRFLVQRVKTLPNYKPYEYPEGYQSPDESFQPSTFNTLDLKTSAFKVAIKNLLTASAALDSIGMSNGSTLSLKLASLVSQAQDDALAKIKEKVHLSFTRTGMAVADIQQNSIYVNIPKSFDTFRMIDIPSYQGNLGQLIDNLIALNNQIRQELKDKKNFELRTNDEDIARKRTTIDAELIDAINLLNIAKSELSGLNIPTTPITTEPSPSLSPSSAKSIDPRNQYNLGFFLGKDIAVDGVQGSQTTQAINEAKRKLNMIGVSDAVFFNELEDAVMRMPGYTAYGKGDGSIMSRTTPF